ncbi:MAG TPA: methyltransferase domain-containing protein [Bryobacterales bacterium]|nr:methyltransferase domain-containing protein [Bryobacterales bacterium]
MDALLRQLPPGALVLDLAARQGSFDPRRYPGLRVVRLDLEPPAPTAGAVCVRGDAAALPFRDRTFHAVVCNHGLEHFVQLDEAVSELGRVLKPGGGLFLSVPDSRALTDRLYRFFARGGGHVNRFRSPQQVEEIVVRLTGLPCRSRTTLYTSLSFLHPANRGARRNRRLWLLLGVGPRALRWATWTFRLLDRAIGTGLSRYGWAFSFGSPAEPEKAPWTNVCIRCGAGHPAGRLAGRTRGWPPSYTCPNCGERNFFTRDEG